MQVLVVGGTGTLGRQIARRALDQGHEVRCMVRTPRNAPFLTEWGCELTRGDLLKPASLDYALEGVDAVIDPAETRQKVVAAFRMIESKREELPKRKHGNVPL